MKKKNIISFLLAISILLSCSLCVSAQSSNEMTAEKAEKILLGFDLDQEYVLTMDANEKINFAKSLLDNPESLEVSESISHIDEIAAAEQIVNSTDEELIALGATKEEIRSMRQVITNLKDKSDEQLKKEFDKTSEQVKLLRMAIEPNEDYYQKELTGTVVSTSGDISTSQLYFSISKYNNSTNANPVSSRVTTYFRWDKSPWFYLDDDIAISWGGNLNSKDFSRSYYGASMQQGTDSYKTMNKLISSTTGIGNSYYPNSSWVTSRVREHLVSTGIVYNHNMELEMNDIIMYKVKSGYTYQTLYQTRSEGKETKAVARYAHKVFSVYWNSISINTSGSAGFGISLGFGYDYSPLVEANPLKY